VIYFSSYHCPRKKIGSHILLTCYNKQIPQHLFVCKLINETYLTHLLRYMLVTDIELIMHLYFKIRTVREINNGQPRYSSNNRYTRHWTNTNKTKNTTQKNKIGILWQDRYNMRPVDLHLKLPSVLHVTTKNSVFNLRCYKVRWSTFKFINTKCRWFLRKKKIILLCTSHV
jgi:hypothetical protein